MVCLTPENVFRSDVIFMLDADAEWRSVIVQRLAFACRG